MKTTKEERDRSRQRAEAGARSKAGHGMLWGSAHYLLRLLDDADEAATLDDANRQAQLARLGLMERVTELEAVLRAVDLALESEFGGFYLSAPEGEPLHDIREMLRGEK